MKALFDTLKPGSTDWELAERIDPERIPRHIAIIMDGNGRWANRRSLPRVAGHRAGIESVQASVETAARMGVEVMTLYAFSTENWKRPKSEVDTLWHLLHTYVRRELPKLKENGIRLRAIGRLGELPASVRKDLQLVMEETSVNEGMLVNLALNYSGRAELADAMSAIVAEAQRSGTQPVVDEEAISSHLYTAGLPEPDLLIRTSGEMRISNFLLWQIAYSELYVTPTYWPDFRCGDLLRAVLDYQKRDRRFGGLKASPSGLSPVEEHLVGALSAPTK